MSWLWWRWLITGFSKHIHVNADLLVCCQHIHDKQILETRKSQLCYTQNLNQTSNLDNPNL